jgi:hypothetical protein
MPSMKPAQLTVVVVCWFGILAATTWQATYPVMSPVWLLFTLVNFLLVLGMLWTAHTAGRDEGFSAGFTAGYGAGVKKTADEMRTVLYRTFGLKDPAK